MASYIREKPVPAYIKEKIQQLKAHQETIEHLKNRIAIEREACHQLEKELELYHASVAPIRNCPPEILSMFFEYYVAENPRLIRRLLLVCRLWHRIAINTPQFWTTIKVSFNSTLIKATNQSNSRFIKACLEHSAESLLHVDVDFRAEDVWALDWSEIKRAFIRLTGTQGSLMWRWKTASISLPDDEGDDGDNLIESIWVMLVGLTPNLMELTLRGVWNRIADYELLSTQGFHDLGALKRLVVNDALDEEVLKMAPTSLEYLSIHLDIGTEEWPQIHRFASLQTLVLLTGALPFTDHLHTEVYNLRLPLLHTMAFIGEFNRLQSINFHCPSLQHVAFVPKREHAYHYQLASLQPKNISWGIFEGEMTTWQDIYVKRMVKKVLLYYRSVESLKIPEHAEKPVREVIEDLRNSRSLPESLKVLLVASPGRVRSIPLLSE